MALEVRLLDDARLTKDIDLGLRGDITSTVDLHERLIDILTTNLGMLRDFGERENSRVRDLVDLTILLEHDLLEPEQTAAAVQTVWLERNNTPPPHDLPPLPESWLDRYQRLAANHDINIPPYPAALAQVTQLWHHMFTRE